MNVSELVRSINATRPTDRKPILNVAECDFCGEAYAIQPQDLNRIQKVRGRFCCWAQDCRRVLRKAQNQESKLVNPNAT